MKKFGERLRQLRTARGLSQMDFSKLIQTSKSSVNMYERGEREPNFETLEKIADFFNVDMDYLLGKSDTVNRFQLCNIPNDAQTRSAQVIHPNHNVLKIAGRDGSYMEKNLSDEDLAAVLAIVNRLPDAAEDL